MLLPYFAPRRYNQQPEIDGHNFEGEMLAIVQSGAVFGTDAVPVQVEVDYNPQAVSIPTPKGGGFQ